MTAATRGPYPASLTLDPPERLANWRPLVQWFLAIPHLLIVNALQAIAQVTAVISWFAILFTGRDIQGLQEVRVMYLRYSVRTTTYAAFLVEEYPPFAFPTTAEDPADVARVRVDVQPRLEERNRVTTFFRPLLVIPHVVVLALLAVGALVCLLIAVFAVLFTGRWPEGLRDFVVNVMRWGLRLQAYLYLLTDEYPPFSLD